MKGRIKVKSGGDMHKGSLESASNGRWVEGADYGGDRK